MQFVFATDSAEHELDLRINHPEATVGDLLDALPGAAEATGLEIANRFCDGELALAESGLFEGAVIRGATGPLRPQAPPSYRLEVRVIAGADAGRTVPLGSDEVVVGREPSCALVVDDPAVSRRHCQIVLDGGQVKVNDLDSANGTLVEGRRISGEQVIRPGDIVEVGDVALQLVPAVVDDLVAFDPVRQAAPSGTVAFNRPPRVLSQTEQAALDVPQAPTEPVKAPFNTTALLAPVVMGGVMVAVMRNAAYAAMVVLSPLMMLGNWWETRRRAQRSSRSGQREYRQGLERFRAELKTRAVAQIADTRVARPDPAEIRRRAHAPSAKLWERRPLHPDYLRLQGGIGNVPWRPPVAETRGVLAPEVIETIEHHRTLRSLPVEVDLSGGGVVGIVGRRSATVPVARNLLCQAAVLHGPADLAIAITIESEHGCDWQWTKWLPHTRDVEARGEARLIASGAEEGQALMRELLRRKPGEGDGGRTTLLLVDSERMTAGRGSQARSVLRGGAGPAAGIVIAGSEEQLPAICTTVIDLTEGIGDASLRRPDTGEQIESFLAAGMSIVTAQTCARDLSRFEDPELESSSGNLPDFVNLLPLLELPRLDAEAITERWRGSDSAGGLTTPVGVSEDGRFVLDMVADGAHGLVGGTTGAGKSELLRTLVAGLAANYDPSQLNFVLIDYKGGSAFADCAKLPHTVGMVTDLDEQLGQRALDSLKAELQYRSRVLSRAGAEDLPEYMRQTGNDPGAEPLPRLLVIIDEFATMAAELPEFIDSLVGIAQRGRSLGAHLILATQRPSGAVNENIKGNTNLRICLRMQSPQDSTDVIDSGEAAKISRTRPGRALVRLGPGELVAIQTALVSGVSTGEIVAPLDLAPFTFGRAPRAEALVATETADDVSDLVELVDTIENAFAHSGAPAPRQPWLPPLPLTIPLDEILAEPVRMSMLGPATGAVPLAMADDPARQAQYPVGWDPAAGNLLLYGIGGSGTTSTLATIALAIARVRSPDDAHLYVLDFGTGELRALSELPHVGAVVTAGETEREARLIHRLRGELDGRRQLDSGRQHEPDIFLLIDNFGTLAAEHDDVAGMELMDALQRVYADGPDLGIYTAVSADRVGAVPSAIASLTQQRLAFRMSDPHDYSYFGLRPTQVPRPAPGRCVTATSGQVLQVGWIGPDVAAAVAATVRSRPTPNRPPAPVGELPRMVALDEVADGLQVGRHPWRLPLGIGAANLGPAGLEVFDGEHVLIAGPARSGKTATLVLVSQLVSAAGIDVYAIAGRRSVLADVVTRAARTSDEIPELCRVAMESDRPRVLLVDDAHSVEDGNGSLKRIAESAPPGLHLVIAGRADALRGLYGHWTQAVRRSHTGLLLMPNPDIDGDLLGVTLPRRHAVPMAPGRGYLVSGGVAELAQVALPHDVSTPRSAQ